MTRPAVMANLGAMFGEVFWTGRPRARLWLRAVLVAVAVALATPVFAADAAKPAAAPAGAPVSADELQKLVDTLQDQGGRDRLVEQLKALIAAQRGRQAEQPPDAATLLGRVAGQIDAFTGEILATATVLLDAPRFLAWLQQEMSDPAARERWLDVGLKLSIIFGFALFGEWAVRRMLGPARNRLVPRPGDGVIVKLLYFAIRAAIDALPILAFAGLAYFILPWTQPRYATSRVATIFVNANVTARVILAVAQNLLLPLAANGRFLGWSEETRNYLFIWTKRFTNVAVYGWAVAEGGWWLGIPGGIYTIILKAVALVLAVLAIVFVLQNRAAAREWLRGGGEPAEAARMPRSGWRVLRNRVADTWHVLAICYIVGIYAVYALRIQGGFLYVVRATALSLIVVLAARIIVGLARRVSHRGFAISPDLKHKFPTLETRANRYLPILSAVVAVVVYCVAALTVLQAWNVEAFSWFQSSLGRRFTGGVISIATALLAALVVWELFSSAIERYLAALDESGQPIPRSARARTLVPLLRTAMMVFISVVVSLIVLSELGVNIAPLLAGAGVIGLAIGFGSQALVKDIITGLFILIEDTLAVGDIVDVGKGHSGVVEAITVRTIRLRDAAGTVHTIPWSEVTTVNNMTRDYAYFVANVAVSYREDTDRVVEVLREVGEEIAAEPTIRPFILEPLEVIGVDKLAETGLIIQARIKALPTKQWAVGREFNRLLKKAFDRHGIEMPYNAKPNYLAELHEPEAEPERKPGPRISQAG
jgi:small conductance mechanosensitive channel